MVDGLRRLWTDECTIFDIVKTTDPDTGRTVSGLVARNPEPLPCRLSFSTLVAATVSDNAAAVSQVVKLFLDVEVDVSPGSRIDVARNGQTTQYRSSGIPARYSTHQEVILEPTGKRA